MTERKLLNEALCMNNSELSVVPISVPDKFPKMLPGWKKYGSKKACKEEITRWFSSWQDTNIHGIGIVCGAVSGGLEVIDFDNHLGNVEKVFNDYKGLDEVSNIIERHTLPYEKTPSGGFHLYYRCSSIDGNAKLASGMKDQKKACIIETRGEGGLIVCSPTKGYSLISGDLCQIGTISQQEREILLAYAKAFNQIPSNKPAMHPVAGDQQSGDERTTPGDLYDQQTNSIAEVKQLLTNKGWTSYSKGNVDYMTRPDKKQGISATFGSIAPNILYVFSSNAWPFESETAYTPFQILALLKYSGDFKSCARELAANNTSTTTSNTLATSDVDPSNKGTTSLITEPEKDKKSIIELLKTAKIDFNEPLSEPPAALKIKNGPNDYSLLGTLGNFAAIIGKAKSRKTFLVTVATAAALDGNLVLDKVEGCLPKEQNKVIYFDTEQSKFHVQKLAHRIVRLLDKKPEDLKNLDVYCLRPLATAKRLEMIEFIIKSTPNLGLIVIDGIRDLIRDINSPDEATMISDKLLAWTEEYKICILVVLHQNKGDSNARGHLGTEIINKAESTISVTKHKGDKNISVVEAEYVRNKEFEPFAFTIDEDGLPEICDTPEDGADNQRPSLTPDSIDIKIHIEVLQEIFKTNKSLAAGELRGLIKQEFQKRDIRLGDNKARIFIEHQYNQAIIKNVSNSLTKKEYVLEDKYLLQHTMVTR